MPRAQRLVMLTSLYTLLLSHFSLAHAQTGTDPTDAFDRDRAAILAMAGSFAVEFAFEETVRLDPNATHSEPYTEHATELVLVIEDRGQFISLQHILVVEGDADQPAHVVKHWRQDWTYQDIDVLDFKGRSTWARRAASRADAAGAWTQAVYQVDDSPRYEALGRWTHVGAWSSWESDDTWRPLPRRELDRRHEYHVLAGTNRHTITPDGWVHEQGSRKLALDDAGQPSLILAHEQGLNTYTRIDNSALAAAQDYWEHTADFWHAVRAEWSAILAADEGLVITPAVDGQRLQSALFDMAALAATGLTIPREDIQDRLLLHTTPPRSPSALANP